MAASWRRPRWTRSPCRRWRDPRPRPGLGEGPAMEPLIAALTLQAGYNAALVAVGASLLGFSAGASGTFLFLRKRALVADAVAHATLPGVGLAFIVMVALGGDGRNLAGLLAGSAISAGIGLLIVDWMTRAT